MLSLLFYTFYIAIAFFGPFCILSEKYAKYVIGCLLFTAQFNVTVFFKLGLTFSFFEISLFLSVVLLVLSAKKIFIGLWRIDLIFLLFLAVACLSIIIAQIRIKSGALSPSLDVEDVTWVRSIKSLNRLIIYLPALIILRTYLLRIISYEDFRCTFILFLAYSGVLPAVATLIQFSGIGFSLIHNNPSFSETYKIVDYLGERPVGLTNEASFYVYQLFFSFCAAYFALKEGLMRKRIYFVIFILYFLTVVISLSRTGLLIFILFLLYKTIKEFSLKKLILITTFFIVSFVVLKNVSISNFNIVDRLTSSFVRNADLSTIERYGSTEGIFNLLKDRGSVFGVGIYNYGFYIKDYLPPYTKVISYENRTVPSFNFILQLIAELGVPLFILWILAVTYINRQVHDSFVSDWFFFLFLFALSFQVLNFAIPFLICLYPYHSKNEPNPIYH